MRLNMELLCYRCCGIREIAGLSSYTTPEAAFRAMSKLAWVRTDMVLGPNRISVMGWVPQDRFRYVIFSQALTDATYGIRFADFILTKKLGALHETDFNLNPNSRNQLKVWMWTVD